MAQQTDSCSIYVIGKNFDCELGLKREQETTTHLVNIMSRLNKDLKAQIYSGNKFTIYRINNHNYWVGGDNEYGQCGLNDHYPMQKLESIDYFDENQIEIKQVFTNVTSTKTFWITSTNSIRLKRFHGLQIKIYGLQGLNREHIIICY